MSQTPSNNLLCTSFLQNVRGAVSPECYQTWFKELSIDGVDGTIVRVSAPNRYVKHWLESHYKRELLRAVAVLMPDVREVQITVVNVARASNDTSSTIAKVLDNALPASLVPQTRNGSHSATPIRTPAPERRGEFKNQHPASASQSWLTFSPFSLNLRLESFLVGKCNRIAHAAAQSVAESPAVVYNPLVIHGGQGLGKSHLLQGIGHLLSERKPAMNVVYCSCEEFTNAYVTAVQSKRTDEFRLRFRSADALLMDDIHFLAGREKTQEEFLHTFDALRNNNKQVVLCSNCPPREIKKLNPSLVTRLQSGLVARMEAPEPAMRMEVLREKAKRRGMNLSPDVIEVLASQVDGSIRELEGVVCKVMALAAAESKTPDRELAILAMRELGYLRSGPLTLQDILAAVCQHYSLSADEIRSDKRHASLVHARHVGMYLSKQLTSQGVAEIGRFYGNRNHATVLHASRKISDDLKRDDNLKHEILVLRQVLGR
ncbi:MAG TPA: chromosomal replication initiator protein DnaA [Planctomycetota bacterium]|nr:chromosomal replication initiator protein DnaA [Planctomycetota bacterium]